MYSYPPFWFYLYLFVMKQKILLWMIGLLGLWFWFSCLLIYRVVYYQPNKIPQDPLKKEQTALQNQTFQTPFVEKVMEEISLTGFLFPREEDYGDFLFKYGEQNFSFLKQLQKQYRKQKKCFTSRDGDRCGCVTGCTCQLCWPLTWYRFTYKVPEYWLTLRADWVAPELMYPRREEVFSGRNEEYFFTGNQVTSWYQPTIDYPHGALQYAPNYESLSFSGWFDRYFPNFTGTIVPYDCKNSRIQGSGFTCFVVKPAWVWNVPLVIFNTQGYNSFLYYTCDRDRCGSALDDIVLEAKKR